MKLNKAAIKNWLPPILLKRFQKIGCDQIVYEGPYTSWSDASMRSRGYDSQLILDKVLEGTLTVRQGGACYERDSVLFHKPEYNWQVLTCLLAAAVERGGSLNLIDYGGSLGGTYFQHRKLLRRIGNIKWNVIEQKNYVDAGRRDIADETLKFYYSLDECLLENSPSVVYFGSSLQYLDAPKDILKRIAALNIRFLIIDRTPFVSDGGGVVVQRVPKSIYSASYPMWIFSERELVESMDKKWEIVSVEPSAEQDAMTSDGVLFGFKNIILESHND
jgi:putative methyltransferase (TIGR04325 family)